MTQHLYSIRFLMGVLTFIFAQNVLAFAEYQSQTYQCTNLENTEMVAELATGKRLTWIQKWDQKQSRLTFEELDEDDDFGYYLLTDFQSALDQQEIYEMEIPLSIVKGTALTGRVLLKLMKNYRIIEQTAFECSSAKRSSGGVRILY